MDNNEEFFVAYDIIEGEPVILQGKREDYGDKLLNETEFFDDFGSHRLRDYPRD